MPHKKSHHRTAEEREMRNLKAGEAEHHRLPAMHLSSKKRYVGEASGPRSVHTEVARFRSGYAPNPQDMAYKHGKGVGDMRKDGHQGPQASSMPGQMGIIHDVRKPGKGAVGIPGIISSTTLGPEQRGRLVSGIIEHPMEGEHETGPVHKVMGVDATAYNTGMAHIAGSRFR